MRDSSENAGDPGADRGSSTPDASPVPTTGATRSHPPASESSSAADGTAASVTSSDSEIDPALLPAAYDRLVPIDQLVHGPYNPRMAQPSDTLRRSIATEGLVDPLIVWPSDETDADGNPIYHITDGWQRYQAAVDAGWTHLPVRIYDQPVAAINETATRGEVDEFSTYHWATLCRNLAAQLDASSESEQVRQIADMVNRTPQTVRKYLAVLSLPDILHPLVRDGPPGDDSDWAALSNYNDTIRRYDGLTWETAHHLARHADELSHTRLLGVAATAVEFDSPATAKEYITAAADQPDIPLATLRKQVRFGSQHRETLEVPRTTIDLDPDAKRALMEYCRQHRRSLTDIVENRLQRLATEAAND